MLHTTFFYMGEKLSAVSTLSVEPAGVAPAITQEPTIQEAGPFKVGDPITITVAATGDPAPTFRWRRGEVDLADDGRITGSGTAALMISSAQLSDAGSYDVVVENSKGMALGEGRSRVDCRCPGRRRCF